MGPFFCQKKGGGYGARALQPAPAAPGIAREKHLPFMRSCGLLFVEGLLCARCLSQFL